MKESSKTKKLLRRPRYKKLSLNSSEIERILSATDASSADDSMLKVFAYSDLKGAADMDSCYCGGPDFYMPFGNSD